MILCDIESTSLRPSSAEIITADFIYCDKNYNIFDKRSFKFRPRIWDQEASEAVLIHGITRDEAYSFNDYKIEARKMFMWLTSFQNEYLVCHANRMYNSTYDCAILKFHALDNGCYYEFQKSFPESKFISTHSVAQYLDLPCPKQLKEICNYYGVSVEGHHNSEKDVMMCYQILKRMNPNLDKFLEWEKIRKGSKYEVNENTLKGSKGSRVRQGVSAEHFGNLL